MENSGKSAFLVAIVLFDTIMNQNLTPFGILEDKVIW